MDPVIEYYFDKTDKINGDELEQFSNFFDNNNLTTIEDWLKNCFEKRITKNDTVSTEYRNEGNYFYSKKCYKQAISCYLRSVCFATYNSESYGLALANKSAALFMLKDYNNSLKDIQLCLKSAYPNKLRIKVLIRQAECYSFLGNYDSMNEVIITVTQLLETVDDIKNREHYKKTLSQIDGISKPIFVEKESIECIPVFKNGENKSFPSASTSLKINFNKEHGRHVVATENIKRGDILFIEKAFISALIFSDNKEFDKQICYNCLKNVVHIIPCKYCTKSYFCSEDCFDVSWNNCHKWECTGMQTDLFYELGIAFPALKAALMGVKTEFENPNNKYNNYTAFNKLITHFEDIKNTFPLIIFSATVVLYLQNYTDFFECLLKCNKFKHMQLNDLKKFVGGKIVKHIAQLSCNSSIISHWQFDNRIILPDCPVSVACGMYTSVSKMNHSCNPNVSLYYIYDVIIVKALNDIKKNEEVFNCYGIDYRYMAKNERQELCENIYYFTCECNICCDSSQEIGLLDHFKCSNCSELFSDDPVINLTTCSSCENVISLSEYRKKKSEAKRLLEGKESKLRLKNVRKSLTIVESILVPYHSHFSLCYNILFSYYLENSNLYEAFKYFMKALDIEKIRYGKNSRNVGTELLKAVSLFIKSFKGIDLSEIRNYLELLKNIEELFQESRVILQLYYPSDKLPIRDIDKDFENIKLCFTYNFCNDE